MITFPAMVLAGQRCRLDEKGTRCGVANRRQVRDCPRNCKRIATPDRHWPLRSAGKVGRAKTRKSGDLPSMFTQIGAGRPGWRHDGICNGAVRTGLLAFGGL